MLLPVTCLGGSCLGGSQSVGRGLTMGDTPGMVLFHPSAPLSDVFVELFEQTVVMIFLISIYTLHRVFLANIRSF